MKSKIIKPLVVCSVVILLLPQNITFAQSKMEQEDILIQSDEKEFSSDTLDTNELEPDKNSHNENDMDNLLESESSLKEEDEEDEEHEENDLMENQEPKIETQKAIIPKYSDGDEGEHVRELKKSLSELGFGNFPQNPSKRYGSVTANVVKNFQKTFGLKVTGEADSKTLEAIEKALASDFRIGKHGSHVRELKRNLTQLGFGNFPQNPSEKYGTVTANVVKEFQAYHGLLMTGIADTVTRNKIADILDDKALNIVQLKKDLTELGFGNFPANPSERYGTVTANVVKDFQKTFGLKVTGEADPKTLDSIANALSSDYRNGKSGTHVRELKKELTQLGFGNFPRNPSLNYGTVTADVVKDFQGQFKLPMTGIADNNTRNKMKEILNPPFKNGHQGLHISQLKRDLRELGFGNFPDNPSIIYGSVTSRVVKDFQKAFGLNESGNADQKTLDKIKEILTSDYRIGKKGTHVRDLKKDLTQLGFGNFPKNPSTTYGAITARVVKKFQAHYKLPQTGVADKITRDKIKEVLNPPYRNGDRGLAIVQLKRNLSKLGFGNFPNNPSLTYGKVTANVVKEFQKAHNLTQDGIAGNETLGKIKLELENLNQKPTITTTYTNYGITLNRALEIQLHPERLQQTDKYRNESAYVSGKYLEFIGTGIIAGTTVNVRTKPNLNSNSIAYQLKLGDKIKIVETVEGTSYQGSTLWYKFEDNKKHYYVHSAFLTGTRAEVVNTSTLNVRAGTNTATHIYGKLNRNDIVSIKKPVGSWYSIGYKAWRNPTRSDLQKYLNPSNHDKFQHLRLDSSIGVPASELNKVLRGKGILEGQGQAFINAAKKYGINEAYLISHAFLETGNGTSTLAKGVKHNGKTVYNMFGIGAVDSNPVNGGAKTAYENGWFTPAKAIEGGAKWIGQGYIGNEHGQNTLYKMKWNPNMGNGYAYKQYATDIAWATKQVNNIKVIYDMIDNPNLHFDIPVYK